MGYIQSKNIKVYPTANRKQPFDPESIYRSEANSVLANKLISPNKQGSYVLTETYDSTKPLEFVLGGYYFKIKDPSVITQDNKDYYCAGIIIDYRSPEQSEEQDIDNTEFSSKILKNLEGIVSGINAPNTCLDDSTNSFTGLYIYSNSTSIDTSKFTDTLRLLEKQNDVYIIPESSKFSFDTRLIKDFNNPAKYLSDYFLNYEFKNTPGWITTRKVHADEIKTTKVSSVNEIKLDNSVLNITNESWTTDPQNTTLTFNTNKVNINTKQHGSINFENNPVHIAELYNTRNYINYGNLTKIHSLRHFINTQYLTFSNYKITNSGQVKEYYKDITESVNNSLSEDLIIYSPTNNTNYNTHWSHSTPNETTWNPKDKFFEKQIEEDLENHTTRDVIERIRFGGLTNVDIKDYPYIGISNFYNASGDSADDGSGINKDCFGWTELGGKPIKVHCVSAGNKEYNVTRYVKSKYNSAKLSPDGLTLHAPFRPTTPTCVIWPDKDVTVNPRTFTFDVKVSNINSFVYMNEKYISCTAKPTDTPAPSSQSTSPVYLNPHYQISGKFVNTSGLVIGTGFTQLDLNPNQLPDDCRSIDGRPKSDDVSLTTSPIPIIISNGIDPGNFNPDYDLVGRNWQVLLDSKGYSHLLLGTDSDERLKYNIHNYYPVNSILDVPVKEFTYKKDNRTTIGFVAQDLQKYFPELVREGDQGYLMIDESKIVYLLLDEVKKLRREIDELKK